MDAPRLAGFDEVGNGGSYALRVVGRLSGAASVGGGGIGATVAFAMYGEAEE